MASRHLVGLTSALAVVMCASVAAIQVANPQMRSSCKFVYTAPDGSKSVTFDSASLCSTTDYILTDVKGHNYYAQICGTAKHNCLPATWQHTCEYISLFLCACGTCGGRHSVCGRALALGTLDLGPWTHGTTRGNGP